MSDPTPAYDPLQDYQDYLNDGTPYGDKAADEEDEDAPDGPSWD